MNDINIMRALLFWRWKLNLDGFEGAMVGLWYVSNWSLLIIYQHQVEQFVITWISIYMLLNWNWLHRNMTKIMFTYRTSIPGWVIMAIHIQVRQSTNRHLLYIRHEIIGNSLWILSNFATLMRSNRVEVS